jgi:hypothetical protein
LESARSLPLRRRSHSLPKPSPGQHTGLAHIVVPHVLIQSSPALVGLLFIDFATALIVTDFLNRVKRRQYFGGIV